MEEGVLVLLVDGKDKGRDGIILLDLLRLKVARHRLDKVGLGRVGIHPQVVCSLVSLQRTHVPLCKVHHSRSLQLRCLRPRQSVVCRGGEEGEEGEEGRRRGKKKGWDEERIVLWIDV